MWWAIPLVALLGLLGARDALAADQLVPASNGPAFERPTVSVAGSISPSFTDNALFSRNGRQADFFFEPDITLRVDGNITPDLSWRVYVRAAFDAFARVKDANEANARIGGRLTQNMFDWRVSLIYENRYEYAGIFEELLFTAHDVKASITRDFTVGNATFSPLVLFTYRFADVPEARRYRLDLVLPIEIRLDPRWAIVSTPLLEGYWFTDGLNEGRRDWIYSTSLGLRYRVTDSVSLTANAVYEARTSNVPLRHYRDFTIGPKLDFIF
jgi:hypothetical protein